MKEIECRFLEIDKPALVKKLAELGAKDEGEQLLDEVIIYDPELKWVEERKLLRLRTGGGKTTLAYKHHHTQAVDGTEEIEFEISNFDQAEKLLETIGFKPYRRQQKKRHAFVLDGVSVDIDTWPKIPTFVELEGKSEADLKKVATTLGLDWAKAANFHDARWVIEEVYHLPVSKMHYYTFDRVE